jgi:hypothetical protein
MGSSKRMTIPAPPPPNPNAAGATGSTSRYNVPVVGGYDSNNYTPFFMQQAANPMEGQPMSYFNKYGSVGNDPAQQPWTPSSVGGMGGNNVMQFAGSARNLFNPLGI